jgi:hypothetical protein
MQPVPCLRISERPVRFSSDHNTRWRLSFTQIKQKTLKSIEDRRDAALRRDGATTGVARKNTLSRCLKEWLKASSSVSTPLDPPP